MDKRNKDKSKETLNRSIVAIWERVFNGLRYFAWFTLFKLVFKKCGCEVTPSWVEVWVVFNTMFAIVSPMLIYFSGSRALGIGLCVYAGIRTFEVIIYQVNVLIFDEYRARMRNEKYHIESNVRMIILLLHNLVEIICWFATFYITMSFGTGTIKGLSLGAYYFSSLTCFVASDTTNVMEIISHNFVGVVAVMELCCGLFMTIIMLARFVGALPQVKSKNESDAVIED